MCEKLTSSRSNDDLIIGLDQDRNRRQDELTWSKNLDGKYQDRFMLKDMFGFAKHQEKTTYGIGYNLTLTWNKNEAALHKAVAFVEARVKIDRLHWYVPHYTPSIQQQGILAKQVLSKTPTEIRYIQRAVFLKQVTNRNLWKFELACQENMNVPISIVKRFQQRDSEDSQILNVFTFSRLPVNSCHCTIGTEKHPDSGMLPNYDDDDFSQG